MWEGRSKESAELGKEAIASPAARRCREQIKALLAAHEPADARERADLERISSWLTTATRPMDRSCFEPGHAVASAFVVSRQGRAALIYHAGLRRWLQPGGHAEPGEHDPAEVAAREAREELGIGSISIAPGLFDVEVQRIPARGETPEHEHFDLRFLGRVADSELRAGSDAAHARWFKAEELNDLELDAGLRRMVEKASRGRLL